MPIVFHIPGPLRQFSNGQAEVRADASPATLRDALDLLWKACPGMRDRIVNEQGEIREHVNLFVGDENARYLKGLATLLPKGAEISIVPSISGGQSIERGLLFEPAD